MPRTIHLVAISNPADRDFDEKFQHHLEALDESISRGQAQTLNAA